MKTLITILALSLTSCITPPQPIDYSHYQLPPAKPFQTMATPTYLEVTPVGNTYQIRERKGY